MLNLEMQKKKKNVTLNHVFEFCILLILFRLIFINNFLEKICKFHLVSRVQKATVALNGIYAEKQADRIQVEGAPPTYVF